MSIFPGKRGASTRRIVSLAVVSACLLASLLGGCAAGDTHPADGRITVWADSGLRSRLEPLASSFASREGVRVEFRFASTDTLAQAAAADASADLLILDGEMSMKTLYRDRTVDNYNLFAFRDAGGTVYSIAKPMHAHNYWYAQEFADTVTGADTQSVSGSNPNL